MKHRHLFRAATVALIGTMLVVVGDEQAFAMDGLQQPTAPTTTNTGFNLIYERPGGATTSGGGSSPCTWLRTVLVASAGEGLAEISIYDSQGAERIDANNNLFRTDPQTGDEMTLYWRTCGGSLNLVWVSLALTPQSLIPGFRDEITAVLPLPDPDMSPSAEVGGTVNLGLWVAVTDPGTTTIRLSDGPAWIEGSGTHVGITIDFGNGDDETCAGLGVPYPSGSNDPDQGPCGYTYRQKSPTGSAYQVTLTSQYEVTYVLSNGTADSLGIVERPITFDYEVGEIQTVGTD